MKILLNLFYILLISIMLTLNGCSISNKELSVITSHYKKHNIRFNPNTEICIIIPEVGCSGCIASGVTFFLDNKENLTIRQEKILLVFTSIQSRKTLFRNLKLQSLDSYNHILDTDNIFTVNGDNAIYPLVLFLENGEIVSAKYQSPYGSDVFTEIKHIINKNETSI